MESARHSNGAAANNLVHFNVATVDSDDDTPTLSSHVIESLNQFLEEKNRATPPEAAAAEGKVEIVKENWNLSQFWYDRETTETIANEVISLSNSIDSPCIACIVCHTLYAYLKNMDPNVPAQLLEYDKRFEQYGAEFTFYDYNQRVDLPDSLKHLFPIIVDDPPYLFKGIELKSSWVCIPLDFVLAILANSEMNFVSSQTTTQGFGWEGGSRSKSKQITP